MSERGQKTADRFFPHGLATAIFILTTILFSIKSELMLTDTDFWWHLSSGDLIRKLGKIPDHDVFSFTAGNYVWLNISWAWDVLYSFVVEHGGYYLPLLITAKLNALTLAILTGFILKRKVGPVITIITIIICLVPYTYMLTPRPHQITFLMTMAFYALAHTAVSEKSYKPLIWLPLLMIIWVNIHGGFIVGFMILGAYMIDRIFARDKKTLLYFAGIFVFCLLTTLINPLGIGIFAACNRTLSSALIPIISEWQPLQFNAKYFLHLTYVFLFLITLNPLNKNITFAEKLLSVVWAIAALKHERNLPIFVILSAPVLALNLQQMISGKFANWVTIRDKKYQNDLAKLKVRKTLFVLAISLSAILFVAGKHLIPVQTPHSHPVEEIAYFKQNYQNRRILNDYFQGGYILNKLDGSSKIFIDGRAETAYPPQVVKDYLRYYYNLPGWEKMIEQYNIDAAIIPRDAPNNSFFETNPNWKKVFSGQLDNIYIK